LELMVSQAKQMQMEKLRNKEKLSLVKAVEMNENIGGLMKFLNDLMMK